MKKKFKRLTVLILAVLLALGVFAGCGNTSVTATKGGSARNDSGAAMSYATGPQTEADYYWGGYADENAYDTPTEWYSSEDGGALKDPAGTARATDTEKIIYSGSARVETTEFDETVDHVYEMIEAFDGFIEYSYVTGKDYYTTYYNRVAYRTASFTIRVPRAAFSGFTAALGELGNVTYSSVQAQNITTSYFDTQSRLETYRTEEERLLAMLEKADNVDDMLNIEDRLASVRYNIESLTSTLTNWDSKINYSTLSLEVEEVKELTVETPIKQTFWQKLGEGFVDSCSWLWDAIQNVVIFVISALPVLIIPAVVIVVIIILIKAKKRKKKAQKPVKPIEIDD